MLLFSFKGKYKIIDCRIFQEIITVKIEYVKTVEQCANS